MEPSTATVLLRWWSSWSIYRRSGGGGTTAFSEVLALVVAFVVVALTSIVVRRRVEFRWKRQVYVPDKTKLSKDKELNILPFNNDRLQRKLDFLERYEDYGYPTSPCGFIDTWRSRELPGLVAPIPSRDARKETISNVASDQSEAEVYLDYAGSALPTRSLLRDIFDITNGKILANPHSTGPAASRTVNRMEQAQKRILDHFGAHPGPLYRGQEATVEHDAEFHPGYEILFTSGATDALRIVAERFPWSACDCQDASMLVYPHNAHTSVIGMRGAALQREPKATFQCLLLETLLEDIARSTSIHDGVNRLWKATGSPDQCGHCQCPLDPVKNLLVLPMECNFGGDRPNVELALQSLRSNTPRSWYTVLDVAKAACTSPVNLCQLNPDFACVSFYKMFGEPTGLGCLFVKRSVVDVLAPRPNSDHALRGYFGGGSVDAVLAGGDFGIRRSDLSRLSSLISGTSHFRGIVSLIAGFDELDRLGGMKAIHQHTTCLAQELVHRLRALRHGNGCFVARVYGAWGLLYEKHASDGPGPTVAFNVVRADGTFVGYNEVAKLAALHQPPIQLRTGCFCNPGACQRALQLTDQQAISNFLEHGHACGDHIDIVNGLPTGAIRASFGKDSIWEDMDVLVSFLEQMFVSTLSDVNSGATCDKRPSPVAIGEIYVFPIKSCAAQRVKCWQIDSTSGRLRYDREFALVDSSGTAMRLQTFPTMALLQPEIDVGNDLMTVRAPGQSPLLLHLSDRTMFDDSSIVKVCGSKCSGMIWGDRVVSDWFSNFLGTRCWLARISPEHDSTVPGREASTMRRETQLAFVNDHPLLVISASAVRTLNNILSSQNSRPVSSRQFRPNLVIRFLDTDETNNPPSTAEDHWTRLRFVSQDIALEYTGRCARCSMVDIDPLNGTKVHILRALAGYRRSNGQITFGVYFRGQLPQHTSTSVWMQIREGDVLVGE